MDQQDQVADDQVSVSCRRKLVSIDGEPNAVEPNELGHVNDDCILHLMTFFNLMDKIHLGETCRRMKLIARMSYHKTSHFTFGGSLMNESALPLILQEIGDNLRSLEIHRLNVNILDHLLEYCPNVTELKLVDPTNIFNAISFDEYQPFLQHLISLEIRKSGIFYRQMSRVKRYHSFDELLCALTKSNTLESLKIDYIETADRTFHYLKAIKNLKCLHLIRYNAIAPVLPIITNFAHLIDICLSIEDSKTSEIVAELTVKG